MAMVSFFLTWGALAVLCAFLALPAFLPPLPDGGLARPKVGGAGVARPGTPQRGTERANAEAQGAGMSGAVTPCAARLGACRALAPSLPLVTLCALVLLLCLAGCLGRLRAGMWLFWLLGAGALAALGRAAARCARRGQGGAFWRGLARQFASPAWLLAFGGSAALALFLALRQPLFTQWDEFSFWGTAAKVVKDSDALYTQVTATNLAARSYPPALPLLGYAFAFCSPSFVPWLVLAGYGALYFAVFGALLGGLPRPAAAPAAFGALACALAPFAVECWYPRQTLLAYSTAYADLMLGLLCAGGCAVWYNAAKGSLRGGALAAALAAVGCVTAALALTKDVGLPLGLVVMLVCALDCAVTRWPDEAAGARRDGPDGAPSPAAHLPPSLTGGTLKEKIAARLPAARRPDRAAGNRWGRLWRPLLVAAVCLAAAVGSYAAWSLQLQNALGLDRSETGGSAGLSTVGMVVSGLRELLGIQRSEKFAAVLRAMAGAFFRQRVTVFGSGLLTVGAILLLLALAFVLTARGQRRRVTCFAVASGLGYLGYTFFQLLCYVYVFSEVDGRGLASYPRYMSTYYLFWLLGALGLLLGAVHSRHRWAPLTVVVSASALLALCCLRILPQDTLLGRSPSFWDDQRLVEQRAAQALQAARASGDPVGEKVLLVSQWDDGGRWYRYAYALEPLALFHLPGDNTLLPRNAQYPGGPDEPLRQNAATIGAFLRENGCTLLLMDVDDDDFHREYAALFTDGMAGFEAGDCFAYRVQYTEDGVRFVPWMEVGP